MRGSLEGRFAACILAAILASACEEVEQVQDRFRDLTPHEAYLASLTDAGLAESALARDWIAAGYRAVEGPAAISLPFQEEGFITAEEPGAMAYRLQVAHGQRLTASVALEPGEGTRVFVDLFRVPTDERDPMRPVLSTDSVPGDLRYEPDRDGEFILRVQPELLRGGRYRVVLRLEAQLAFPVQGEGDGSIGSSFGVERDGGRRSHAGIDIFAPRGTPVLAASDGVVNRVQVTSLGGKVVWVRDEARNTNVYYAHLDSQLVSRGQVVKVGDVLGFVGNTGNARTTPPHLHFGVYRRGSGAIDPAPFVRRPRGSLSELTADLAALGSWVRLNQDGIRLRAAPSDRAEVVREMGRHTPLRVLGGSGDWYRVRLPDGGAGYVAARMTEMADLALETRTASAGGSVRVGPSDGAPVMAQLDAGAEVPVLGRFDRYLYVRAPGGELGWLGDGEPPS
jgi:murein DD-endopeptidase MepM/ murein hydrolase activator NlpD